MLYNTTIVISIFWLVSSTHHHKNADGNKTPYNTVLHITERRGSKENKIAMKTKDRLKKVIGTLLLLLGLHLLLSESESVWEMIVVAVAWALGIYFLKEGARAQELAAKQAAKQAAMKKRAAHKEWQTFQTRSVARRRVKEQEERRQRRKQRAAEQTKAQSEEGEGKEGDRETVNPSDSVPPDAHAG